MARLRRLVNLTYLPEALTAFAVLRILPDRDDFIDPPRQEGNGVATRTIRCVVLSATGGFFKLLMTLSKLAHVAICFVSRR